MTWFLVPPGVVLQTSIKEQRHFMYINNLPETTLSRDAGLSDPIMSVIYIDLGSHNHTETRGVLVFVPVSWE